MPIIIWTVSIIPVYVQWHLRALGRPWGALPGWVMLLEYACVARPVQLLCFRRAYTTCDQARKPLKYQRFRWNLYNFTYREVLWVVRIVTRRHLSEAIERYPDAAREIEASDGYRRGGPVAQYDEVRAMFKDADNGGELCGL